MRASDILLLEILSSALSMFVCAAENDHHCRCVFSESEKVLNICLRSGATLKVYRGLQNYVFVPSGNENWFWKRFKTRCVHEVFTREVLNMYKKCTERVEKINRRNNKILLKMFLKHSTRKVLEFQKCVTVVLISIKKVWNIYYLHNY